MLQGITPVGGLLGPFCRFSVVRYFAGQTYPFFRSFSLLVFVRSETTKFEAVWLIQFMCVIRSYKFIVFGAMYVI